jgi:uncharacterized membrane protein
MKNVPNEIRKDSINYYTNKLQTTYNNLKKAIYASFIAIFLDTLAIFCLPSIFACIFNIISIIIIIISSLLCLYSFRHNFMHVSFNIYVQSKKVLILTTFFLITILIRFS